MKTSRVKQFFAYSFVILIPAAWLTYIILSTETVNCEVCMSFRGKEQCRKASGPTQEECQRTATDNACAFLASGMTDSIACTQSGPVSITFTP